MFRGTPVSRARYSGFLRNVAIAMGNRGLPQFREPLERLAASGDETVVAEHAPLGARSNYDESVRASLLLALLAALFPVVAAPTTLVDQAASTISTTWSIRRPSRLSRRPSRANPEIRICTITWRRRSCSRRCSATGRSKANWSSGNNSFLRRPKLNPSPETEKRFLDEVDRGHGAGGGAAEEESATTRRHMYALGISYGLRSNYYWVVKKAWRDSLRDATEARKSHNRITELEPGNVDARLVQGLHDYIVGSLPWGYRMLGFLVGVHGDKEKGIRTVQDVAANGQASTGWTREIFLRVLYRRENRPAEAVPLVQDLIRRFPRNYLLRLELCADVQHGRGRCMHGWRRCGNWRG